MLLFVLMLLQSQFDVATIKPNAGNSSGGRTQPLPGGRLHVENQPLRTLIKVAYRVQDWQISGEPGWVNSAKFDIEAKAEGNPPLLDVVGPMLQKLLEDRFQLKTHRETKELPVYVLSAAKGGLKIQPLKEGSCDPYDPNTPHPKTCGSIGTGRNMLNGTGIKMEDLAKSLGYVLGRTVTDRTGFQNLFDAHLVFAADASDSANPSIFTSLQEQLGLKLESSKGPVEVLVIDRVEKPAGN